VSLFDLLPVRDQETLYKERQLQSARRRKAARKQQIQRLGGVRFAPTAKTHDGLLPERDEAARFINRILGQTGETGQGFMKTAKNSWGQWVCNRDSWSPQMAWGAVPQHLKRKTAPIIVSFFRRWKDALAGNLTKTIVVQWGDHEIGLEAELKTVRRGKFQILPGGGCDIALRPIDRTHRLWVDKIEKSVTVQSLQRVAYPSTPTSIQTWAVYGKAVTTIQNAFRKWQERKATGEH
jgi:hypothetical protein